MAYKSCAILRPSHDRRVCIAKLDVSTLASKSYRNVEINWTVNAMKPLGRTKK